MAATENRETFKSEECTVIELSETSDEENSETGLTNTKSTNSSSKQCDVASSSIKTESEVPSYSAFNKFLSECINYLKLPDDQPIINKLTKYYEMMDENFRNSDECKVLVESYAENEKMNESEIYIFLRDVLNEFSSHRRKERTDEPNIPNKRYVKKLEKLLEKLDRKIKKIQEKEVDWDDNSDSIYLLESRLKARFVKVYKILCKVTASRPYDGRNMWPKLHYEGSRYPEINRNISKYVNKTGIFPDYNTILTIVRSTSKEEGIFINEDEMCELAKVAFVEIGEELKQRRQLDFNYTFGCYLTDAIDPSNSDPAVNDQGLKEKLDYNRIIAQSRLDQIIEKYAKEQEDSKAVPVEVGDGLDVSATESDEDEEGSENNGDGFEEEEKEDIDDDDNDDDESRDCDTVIADVQKNSRSSSQKSNGQTSNVTDNKKIPRIKVKKEVHNMKRKRNEDDPQVNKKQVVSSSFSLTEDHEVIVLD